jgi:toxin-antitoxin system PIN domain toxin
VKASGFHVAETSAYWTLGGDLPDVNVWLALYIVDHQHHAQAKRYWSDCEPLRAAGYKLHFNRVTMLGFVRLLCQPKVMGNAMLDVATAYGVYRQLREQPGVGFLPDRETTDAVLQSWVSAMPPRLLTDAWLAAQAESAGLRLITFDADFKRFPLSRVLHLPLT